MTFAFWLIFGCGLLAIGYGIYASREVLAADAGNDRMREISDAVREGASAYLNRQYQTIAVVGVVIGIFLWWRMGLHVALGYFIGAILSAAKDAGLSGESAALLDGWLATRPSYKVLSAWKDYVSALASTMDAAAKDKLKQELLGRARTVAESAGGFLGIGKISSEEEDKLEELPRAFS